MRLKIREQKYDVEFKALKKGTLGLWRSGLIELDSRLRGKMLLEVALHEGLHACFVDLDEAGASSSSEGLATLLWKLGYRRMEA